jgi:hypothetical protein
MLVHRGNTVETAFKLNAPSGTFVSNLDNIIEEHLKQIFGQHDGDYFTYSSELRSTISGKKYKVLFIEDKEGDKHHMFFELIIPKGTGIL